MLNHFKRDLSRAERASESRSKPGNATPRGGQDDVEESLSTPNRTVAMYRGRVRAMGVINGMFGGSGILDAAAIDAELDHAGLNANHNRRAGQMYANFKRRAKRNDNYPEKRARHVTWNPQIIEECNGNKNNKNNSRAAQQNPNANPASNSTGIYTRIGEGVKQAVQMARESANVAQRGGGAGEVETSTGPGVKFLSAHQGGLGGGGGGFFTGSGGGNVSSSNNKKRGSIEISSAPMHVDSPTGPGGITFNINSLFGHINSQAKGALDQIKWNPFGNNTTPDSKNDMHKENRSNSSHQGSIPQNMFSPSKLADNIFVQQNNQAKASAAQTQSQNDNVLRSTSASKSQPRRVSTEMQERLLRYQQAVAQSSTPERAVLPPKTPPPHRTLLSQRCDLATVLSVSTTTPSKTHAAPITPAKTQMQEDLPESPTNSQPHTGPVFLRRPHTPGKELVGKYGHSAVSVGAAGGFPVSANPQKPAGYLGGRGLYAQGGVVTTSDDGIALWSRQVRLYVQCFHLAIRIPPQKKENVCVCVC